MKETTLCYIENSGRYLMLHRIKKKNDVNKDKWVGIGGKFEEGESPEDCLLREVYEETGLTLKDFKYRGIVTFVCPPYESEHMHLFTSDSYEGILTECDEGELVFVDKNKVEELMIWEGDRIFLKLLKDNSPFFSLKLKYSDGVLLNSTLKVYD